MSDTVKAVEARIKGGRLFHAYIITGAAPQSRREAADHIAKAALCESSVPPCGHCRHCKKAERGTHPDISVVTREKDARELSVDQIRTLRSQALVVPNEAARSVFIIEDADTMNASAQNALLKTLEEPPSHAMFLLLADNTELLLTTVRSRCELLSLPPEDTLVPSPEADRVFETMSRGGTEFVRACTALEGIERPEVLNAILWLRRRILDAAASGALPAPRVAHAADALAKCEKYLAANLSAGYIAGVLMAELCDNID